MRILLLFLLVVSALAATTLTAIPTPAKMKFAYCAIPGFASGQDRTFDTRQAAVRGFSCEPNPRSAPDSSPRL